MDVVDQTFDKGFAELSSFRVETYGIAELALITECTVLHFHR
jgi:hypothetical protein